MISVVIPAYNSAQYLREAVESAAAQTYADLEIIILDDGSSDGTWAVAEELAGFDARIVALKNPENLGVAETRNRGIEYAKGNYIAFLDADDAWIPDKLERQLELVEKAGLDICYTGYSFMDEGGESIRRPYKVPERLNMERLLRENVIGLSSVLVRRGAIGKTRMCREFAHEDYVFWLELLQNGCKAGGIAAPLTIYRISKLSRSGDKLKAAKNRWIIYRNFLKLGRLRSGLFFASYTLRGIWKHYL